MPNWCYNSATIICPSKNVYMQLLDAIKNDKWFETFAPLEQCNNGDSDESWRFDSALDVWHTKWPPNDLVIGNEDDINYIIEVSFDTAWTPPTGVYSIMYKNYSIETTAYYYELGCEFFGRCMYDSNTEMDETFDLPSNKKELIELQKKIGSELDDFMTSTWECLEEQWDEEDEDE